MWLAKEGHGGQVGISFLENVQMATSAAAYGAMLADVDYVLESDGIPTEISRLRDRLASHEVARLNVHVDGATTTYTSQLEPATLIGAAMPALQRPKFLAIVSAHVLAAYLARERGKCPDGFVIEGRSAGGTTPRRAGGSAWMRTGKRCTAGDYADLDQVVSSRGTECLRTASCPRSSMPGECPQWPGKCTRP